MEKKIDFVLTWVDGNDPAWLAEKEKYQKSPDPDSAMRYRDWGTLKYWFRGVETYASWVNRIHFVTWGHIPEWLNKDHPRLNIVKHDEYIPKQYLPTFSSHTIELNLHGIPGLSDRFVYFNDDMFVNNAVSPEDFFSNGYPCEIAVLYPIGANPESNVYDHILLNESEFFVRHFDIRKEMKRNFSKWYNAKYGKNLIKTMVMQLFPGFSGFILHHQPISYLKRTFEEVWSAEEALLDKVCTHRFRSAEDVSQSVFRYWQIGKGEFTPYNIMKRGTYVGVGKEALDYNSLIVKGRKKILCLNDIGMQVDFDQESKRMLEAFEKKFPEKSSFER